MPDENVQNGWNEYSRLVLKELETLADGIEGLRAELQEVKQELAKMQVKEEKIEEQNTNLNNIQNIPEEDKDKTAKPSDDKTKAASADKGKAGKPSEDKTKAASADKGKAGSKETKKK